MSRRGGARAGPSSLPVPTYSRGSPANSTTSSQGGRGRSLAHSTEDIPRQFGSSLSPAGTSRRSQSPAARRTQSPGEARRRTGMSPVRVSQTPMSGNRYITEDLIRKLAKEDNLDMIITLNLTLSKDTGKKIKYIENLDRLRKLQTLNLSYNVIEKLERLDKLLRLRDLNVSNNMLTKIEGLENLSALQSLNLSDNHIEHVPPWFAKKLKALRTFRAARNKLESLSEVAKLKPLPDLIQLDIAENPLTSLSHSRLYTVFHLRTVEILDGQSVQDRERKQAHDRFALDEVEQLEKTVEQKEEKIRQLEDSQNKSLQERSQQETSQNHLMSRERELQEKLKRMEQELNAKDGLLKKKTSDLNKASNKHYQLEQELAFYKIDSKFDSLHEAPKFTVDNPDDSGDLHESPYIGRARFRANQYAQETSVAGGSPQQAQIHSMRASMSPAVQSSRTSPGLVQRSLSPGSKDKMHSALDAELDRKHSEVQKTEEKLRDLQADLSSTEKRLMNATSELKKLSTDRVTPEPFRDDNKYKIRQRLARKMQRVNELRDQATQMEEEIDRKHEKITEDRSELHRMQSQLNDMNPSDFGYDRHQRDMLDKEAQVNESSQHQVELQKQLEEALSNITRETSDIKKLEQQLSADQIEQNEELRHELDDIVSGLSGYLENVKGQSRQHKQEFEMLIQEKEGMEEKIRRMEAELAILEGEASNARWMQKRLSELEDSLRKTEDLNTTLQDEVEERRKKDPELSHRLSSAETEARQLRQALTETEKKAEAERHAMENQLQMERERAEKMTHRIQDVNRQELEAKKLLSQLEAAKALNAGLRDQVEEFRHKQQMEEGGFKPSDLKKRLKKFTHEFKANKNPIEPQGMNDILGTTFQDIQKHTQEQFNNSAKEIEELKKQRNKMESESQTLKEKLKKLENNIKKEQVKEETRLEKDNRDLQSEIKKLQTALDNAKERNREGAIPVRIVYRPDSENSADRASSLNSEEKELFVELQRELMDLKRNMRQHEEDVSRKLVDAEAEVAHYREEAKQREKEFETEIEEHRQAADLLREKQEARIQVIAQDLDQAQFVADSLQGLLGEREKYLNQELSNADMSNQMISHQEDELARLYDILETQRDEIENLNQILDHLAQQGPDGVGVAFDDELWRIRQEVNNLKETLAMQSAYVQAMPNVGHMSTQATGYFPDQGSQAGGQPIRTTGAAAGTQVGGGHPYSSVPTLPSKASGSQGTTAGGAALRPHSGTQSGPTHSSSVPSGGIASGAAMASTPMPRSTHSSALVGGEPRIQPMEHLGTERRESKAPHGDRLAVGKGGDGTGLNPQAASRNLTRASDGQPTTNQNGRSSRRSSRSRAPRPSVPSAFEHVHRPEPYHPFQAPAPLPQVAPVLQPGSMPGPPPATQPVYPAAGPMKPGLPQNSMPAGVGLPPTQASQTQGVQGPSRGVQVGGGFQPALPPQMYPAPSGGQVPMMPMGPLMALPPDAAYPMVQGPVTPAASYPMAAGNDPAVAFDPFPIEINYNPGSALIGGDGSGRGTNYTVGDQTYLPSGPAQFAQYGPGRVFLPAGHSGQHPARIYYPANHNLPLLGPGGVPPPPPVNQGYTPMTPVATGTPIKGGVAPPSAFYDSSFMMAPPSPIRPVDMEGQAPRGILKHGVGEGGDDSYLFCNVPEHHDLEDYVAELQEKLKKLKVRIVKEKDIQEESLQYEDRKTVKRLLRELEDRRDELEGLDLAIERQKRNLYEMKQEERDLKRNHQDARNELLSLKRKNDKRLTSRKSHHRSNRSDGDSFDNEAEQLQQIFLTDEINCLDKTLAKRNAQLREAERSLKDCNTDLRDAKEQARSMVQRYDEATRNLHQAVQEQQEIERRSNDAGVQLVKAHEELVTLKSEVKDIERRRIKQDKLLREVNNVIAKKDSEFKDVDSKVKSLTQSLQRLQADVSVHTQREKEMVGALRDSEDILAKRRTEIQRMRDQIEQNRQELERLDQQMGRRRTELQLLQETHERKKQEMNNVLHEAEAEITSKHRDMKECREDLEQLDQQKSELAIHMKAKRAELGKLKEEIQQEEEVLQHLSNTVTKNKSELKHTLEMQQLEQAELDSVKGQQTQKLMELERTQRALQEEKSDLEQLNAETSRKSTDLDRLRQAIERDRLEVDQLNAEKQQLDDRIASLNREKDMLDDGYKTVDDKLNTSKRNHRIMEEKVSSTSSRLEMLEAELRLREREMEEAEVLKEDLEKELTVVKQNVKENKTELKTLHEHIRDAEEQMRSLEQDVRNTYHQRDEAKQEVERINQQMRQSNLSLEDNTRQEKMKYQEVQDLMRSLVEREKEAQESRMALNKLRKEIEKEENRLNRLVTNANSDLESVRTELTEKQDELENMKEEYSELQKKTEGLQLSEEKFTEISTTCKDLEMDLQERTEEKNELTKALSTSYEEVQRLRQDCTEMQEKQAKERLEMENTLRDMQAALEKVTQEKTQADNHTSSQITELQSLAEKHLTRANQLESELSRVKKEVVVTKKQSDKRSEDKENEKVTQVQIVPATPSPAPRNDDWKKDALRERLAEEQDYLRYQLRQQMLRHSETMQSTRLKSEETIDCLKRKLNTLQEVLFNTNPDTRAIHELTRSRSRSPSYRFGRTRSPSPLNHSGYLSGRRSKSSESLGSPIRPEREFL